MKLNELLKFPKEELAMYILKHTVSYENLEREMKYIHVQYLIDKDEELTEEDELLEAFKKMPQSTIEEKIEKLKVWEKYKKLSSKNMAANNKRQEEIKRLLNL